MAFTFTAAERTAQRVLNECGLRDATDLPVKIIILGRKAFYEELPMSGKDGEIISVGERSIITINSDIQFDTRKRFAAIHELGHYEMHRNLRPLFLDTEYDLMDWYRGGPHEIEANQFASEFLMPSEIFHRECKEQKKIDPKVIEHLANRFQVSKAAAILKFVHRGNHPVFAVFCTDNKMKWWKKSEDFYHFCRFAKDAPPPTGTVAAEIFSGRKAYYADESKQDIWKSDWFEMKNDNEQDTRFFEYCLFIKSYNSTLSIIWEK